MNADGCNMSIAPMVRGASIREMSMRRISRLAVRSILTFVIAISVLIVGAAHAQAHSSLEKTSPSSGEVLSQAPLQLVLTFDQPVRIPNGGIRMLNETGERIPVPRAELDPSRANTLTVKLSTLPAGAYVVSWRAVSEDGHPIRGAFTFRIGAGGLTGVAKLAEELLAGTTGRSDVGTAMAILRTLTFAAMLLLLGSVTFSLFVSSTPLSHEGERSVLRIITGSGFLAGVSGVLGLLLYGPYTAGVGFNSIADGTLLDDTLNDRVGRAMMFRTIAVIVLAVAMLRTRKSAALGQGAESSHDNSHPRSMVLAVAAAIVTLAMQVLCGHGFTGRWKPLAALATIVHVAAASSWIGVLVIVVTVLRQQTRGRGPDASHDPITSALINRFSKLAFLSVGALVGSGLVNSLRQVGSQEGLTSTTYGRLVLTKVGVTSLLVGLGFLSRRALQAKASIDLGRIRKRMTIESLLSIAVIVATSLVVNTAPSREVIGQPVSIKAKTDSLLLDITVDPARRGANRVHFYSLTPQGLPKKIEKIEVTAALPSAGIEPIDIDVVRAGPNHFQALRSDFPLAGTWTLQIDVDVDAFTQESTTQTVTIR
jgi:copper transport protein